jgi:hypothetical protein
VPVLPVRLGQEGAFLFAASTPSDPDHHLALLDQGAGPGWQWLPLVGPDFPLSAYAQRGPLIAWTPHLAGVALKLDRKPAEDGPVAKLSRRAAGPRALSALLAVLLVALLAGNLWYLRALDRRLAEAAPAPPAEPARPSPAPPRPAEDADRERFVAALHRLLADRGAAQEWDEQRSALLRRYDELAARYPDLRLPSGDRRGRVTVAAVSVLAGRSAGRIEEEVRRALAGKGFSDPVIRAACEHVREQFRAGAGGR